MKRISRCCRVATLLLSVLLFAACTAPTPPADTDTTAPDTTAAPVSGEKWEGELPTPTLGDTVLHCELVWMHSWQEYSDGQGAMLTGDGALMFYSTGNYLPQIADKIPTVAWSESLTLSVGEVAGLTHTGGTTVSVYGEDYAELAKHISMDDLVARSRGEWQGKTVYLEFGVTFRHPISAEIEEAFSYCYFAKTTLGAD